MNLVSKNTLNATLHHSTRHLFKRSSRDDELFLFQFLSDFLNCDHEKVKKKKKAAPELSGGCRFINKLRCAVNVD